MRTFFKSLIFIYICLVWSIGTFASNYNAVALREAETLFPDETTEGYERNLDSLLSNYLSTRQSVVLDSISKDTDKNYPKFSDETYINRLALLAENTDVELPFNDKVKSYILMYGERRRGLVSSMLGLRSHYFPLFEEELDRQGLPQELKYLPIIESALNPRAFSRAGASGLWQFVYATGKYYGLQIDTYIDERRDPIQATKSAVTYLKDLYSIYKDWQLVIAAYNCGPGNVNKAIRRTGGKRDYWEIYYRLPKETRGYVPAFIACNYIMNYHLAHNIGIKPHELPVHTDTVMIARPLHLQQVSEQLGIDFELLKTLNPQYRKFYIPGGTKQFALSLPSDLLMTFLDQEEKVYAYKKDEFLKQSRRIAKPEFSSYKPTAPGNMSALYYTVKSGDNLGYIAEWYDTGLSKIRYWNNLYSSNIRVGQKIAIYVPKSKVSKYKSINTMSFAQKQGLEGKTVSKSSAKTTVKTELDDSFVYYQVRRGDNLWAIARNYPGISSKDIQKLNNLRSASSIKIGQWLKIRKRT